MEEQCGTQYYRPETGVRLYTCVKPAGHEGPHDDGAGHIGLTVEKSELAEIERSIKRGLARSGDK
jgi:hypothetical protein